LMPWVNLSRQMTSIPLSWPLTSHPLPTNRTVRKDGSTKNYGLTRGRQRTTSLLETSIVRRFTTVDIVQSTKAHLPLWGSENISVVVVVSPTERSGWCGS
jgi:hypothetical protein